MAWLVGFDPQAQGSGAAGDLLALAAAWLYALYAVSGRRGRGRYSLLTYAFWVYAGAAASLALLAPRTVLLGHVPRSAWGPIALLALLPTTVGHTLFNAAVRSAHAAQANLIATQEVSGGILLGWLLLGEAPSRATLLAWPVMLAGLAWVLVGRWPPGRPRPPAAGLAAAGLAAAGRPGLDPQSGAPASERR
jgi:drug/metabolite transporter (DMT)-like permease